MTNQNDSCPETIEVSIPGTSQTIVDILCDQYGVLDSGEVRAQLEPLEPEVWGSAEFAQLFDTTNINAPYVDVIRKQDGVAGTVMFIDSPRIYFSFHAESGNDERSTA